LKTTAHQVNGTFILPGNFNRKEIVFCCEEFSFRLRRVESENMSNN